MTTSTTETAGHELAYRPEIDGLRAIAVLAVVAFHAGVTGFSGGFAGVDVFFVVSGYLISGIIIRAIERGTFTLRDFYARRVNRIFPALVLTLAGSLALGWYLLFPSEFTSLGRHVVAGSTFLSNVALVQETGYFDVAAEKKPLLHLWSLAIEEQFYLFWPLLLALSWKFRSRGKTPAGDSLSTTMIPTVSGESPGMLSAQTRPFQPNSGLTYVRRHEPAWTVL